jgi:hypothetical protein
MPTINNIFLHSTDTNESQIQKLLDKQLWSHRILSIWINDLTLRSSMLLRKVLPRELYPSVRIHIL